MLRLDGVRGATVNPATEMAYVEYDPDQVPPSVLRALIAEEGFGGDGATVRAAPRGERPLPAWVLPPHGAGLVAVIWLCSLPLFALLVLPRFGVGLSAGVSIALLTAGLLLCWRHHGGAIRGPSGDPQRGIRERT